MKKIKKMGCRIVHAGLKAALVFLRIPFPELLLGTSGFEELGRNLKKNKATRPLILMDQGTYQRKSYLSLTSGLAKEGISFTVFPDVVSDPTFAVIEKGVEAYRNGKCDSLVALGGGSAIDCAKAVGVRVSNPKKPFQKMRKALSIRKRIPYLAAIPTTAGTGSEATLAAVVTNQENGDKFSLSDPVLVPRLALLDPDYLKTLPKSVIADCGMDALTHAVEAYVGKAGTRTTDRYALEAIRLIDQNLVAFYRNPEDARSRGRMQLASYFAGVSFTRAFVGYVHALAHAVGGKYHLPHGYLCALYLPKVLKAYGKSIDKKMSVIYSLLGLGEEKSLPLRREAVISYIEEMNKTLGILPEDLDKAVQEEDKSALAGHADKEANPFYPVPSLLDEKELEELL
ncbi:MAG: iron-containing alcohol dehydrogenase [Bacilli bacterium]|nr:iron-containing alcohol dehydrogenase [Bacilli bacterium]